MVSAFVRRSRFSELTKDVAGLPAIAGARAELRWAAGVIGTTLLVPWTFCETVSKPGLPEAITGIARGSLAAPVEPAGENPSVVCTMTLGSFFLFMRMPLVSSPALLRVPIRSHRRLRRYHVQPVLWVQSRLALPPIALPPRR